MASYRKIKKEKVLEAIEGSAGIVLTVAHRLNCTWYTAQSLINRWNETKKAFGAETEKILDLAEGQVFNAVKEGDIATAKWVLARKGRQRGYEETPTIRLDSSDPLNINFTGNDSLTKEDLINANNIELGTGDVEETHRAE